VTVVLPANGVADLSDAITTPWVQQQCNIYGVLGGGLWTFSFAEDEWNMVTGGQAQSLTFEDGTEIQKEATSTQYADTFVDRVLLGYTSDSDILLSAIERALTSTMNSIWYSPSQGGTFSNYMSWGTQPDGYYYQQELGEVYRLE
jgi:hypothetical protein